MFLGNALGGAELRPTAIKAALRFWWRALQGNLDIKQLHERESAIFGSAGDAGRSKVVLTVKCKKELEPINTVFDPNPILRRWIDKETNYNGQMGRNSSMKILEYLAYGAVTFNDGYRFYIKPEDTFQINLWPKELALIERLDEAMYLCSVFGGLGSKNRNGFGKFDTGKQFDITKLLASDNKKGKFTSVSSQLTLMQLEGSYDSWNDCLGELGRIYLKARVNYATNENDFTVNGLEDEHGSKHRPFIGSPLPITEKQSNGSRRTRTEFPKYGTKMVSNMERHAKTHFLGIEQVGEKYQGYILHLPYEYLANSNEKFGLSDADIATLQAGYNNACHKFNTNLQNLGMKKVEL